MPNGCAVVEIPTHVIKNRKYQFEFEGRDRRNFVTGHERSVLDRLFRGSLKKQGIFERVQLYISIILIIRAT